MTRRQPKAPARGGRGGWEPRGRIQARATRAVDLAIEGWTQQAIAAELHISQAAVCKLLRRADDRALQDLAERVARQKVRHTQRLERLYAEATRAWERSKADATRRRQRQSESDSGAGSSGAHTVAEVIVESQHGDPRYLEASRKTLADLRKLWGLDAPVRLDVRDRPPAYDQLTEAELLQRIAQQDRLLARPAPARSARQRRGR
jgi:predicted transcriptional regulator